MCRCLTRVGHRYWHDSSDSGVWAVSFFIFFASPTRHQRGADTLAVEKKKKKKNQDFDRWTNPWVRSEKSQIRNPHSPIVNFPLLVALCPSRVLHPTDWRVSELPLSLCPFRSLSLSSDMDRFELLFFLFVSWFLFFIYLFFFSFFLSFICWLLWTFGLVFCGVLYL